MERLYRPICDLLACRYPLVLAGMGGVARAELVLAVTRGGGFGFLGMVREPVALIRAEIERIRAHSDRRFGVNLIPASTPPQLLEAQIDACIALRVPVIALFWSAPRALIERLRSAGIDVVCQVGSVAEAIAAQAAGAQALIAQGVEAGGHVKGDRALTELVPEIVAAVELPVLAAGGISDGSDVASIMALGAQGAVLGTAFIATEESFAHPYHKQRLIDAGADDTRLTDAFHINWPRDAKVRVLANSVTSGAQGDPFGATRVIGDEEGRPIYLFSTDSPLRSMSGDFEAMALYAGQGVGKIEAIVSASDLVRRIAAQAEVLLDSGAEPVSPAIAPASPPCFLHELDDQYLGYASQSACIEFLNLLLEAERAGARVAMRTAAQCSDQQTRTLSRDIQRDEARWCGVLTHAIHRLHGTPSRATGAFHDKAMAIENIAARLAFLNRGQWWVVKRLQEFLPKIGDETLSAELREMLASHQYNIEIVDTQLAGDGPGA
ncbi:MAG TPA: nitronate monooxygenase [Solimonas sp.]